MNPIKKIAPIIVALILLFLLLVVNQNRLPKALAGLNNDTSTVNLDNSGKKQELTFLNDPIRNPDTKIKNRSFIDLLSPSSFIRSGDFRLVADSNYVGNQGSVTLVWDAVPNILDGYVIQRTTDAAVPFGDVGWDNPPTNYGKKVKILNVYPPGGNFLAQWMNQDNGSGRPVSMNLIDVEGILLSDFNRNPNGALRDAAGNYKYDGIYFGSEDVNGGTTPGVNDLTAASQPVVAAFGATGRSVIFGHDTVLSTVDHRYFHTFANNLGLVLSDAIPTGLKITPQLDLGSSKVRFTKDGYLNRYPYNLDPTLTYNIKPAHTVGQFYTPLYNATKWMEFEAPLTILGGGGESHPPSELLDNSDRVIGNNNWYLVTKDNYAQIQTGHTTGSCSPDEAKIIANMIYYTSTLTMSSPGEDRTVKDNAAPDVPSVTIDASAGNSVNLKFNTNDNFTEYYYRVKARTSGSVKYSDIVKVPLLSGLKGYIYSIDDNPNGIPNVITDPSSGNVTNINLNPVSSTDNQADINLSRNNAAGKYLHIVAVDKANNVSVNKTINLSEFLWWKYDNGTLTIFPHNLNADVDAVIDYDGSLIGRTFKKWPWHDSYKSQIKEVVIQPGVTATSLENIFYNLYEVEEFRGLSNIYTGDATNMKEVFYKCEKVQRIDLSNWNTEKVETLKGMFYMCKSLNNLNVASLNTSNVKDMSQLFKYTNKNLLVDVSRWDTRKVTNMSEMFSYGVYNPNVSGFVMDNVEDISGMFDSNGSTIISVGGWNTAKVKNMASTFQNTLFSTIDLSNWDTSQVVNMKNMFSCSENFGLRSNLETLDVSRWNTSNVKDMSDMFNNCRLLKAIDVSRWNTSQVENMSSMFNECETVKKLDVGRWNTNNVKNMKWMFKGCRLSKSIDVSNWNTENVTNMESMFSDCKSLESIDVSQWDTKNVESMGALFYNCESLNVIDVSQWNTSKSWDVDYMFANCKKLKQLDLSQFNTRLAYPYYNRMMLSNTNDLWKLKLGPNSIIKGTNLMDPTSIGQVVPDIDDPSNTYYVTDTKWREVGSGDVHNPTGRSISAADIMSESETNSDFRTYVWDQLGRVLLETPRLIDFGTQKGFKKTSYLSSPQTHKVIDNRNVRKHNKWQINAAVTKKLNNGSKTISGNPLYYQNNNGTNKQLSSTATLVSEKNVPGLVYEDIWEEPWKLVYKSSPNEIPEAGSYHGEITFTLVLSTP